MIRSQRFLIVDAEEESGAAERLTAANECVGYFRGIPLILRGQSIAEEWSLPHVWIETWDDGIPQP